MKKQQEKLKVAAKVYKISLFYYYRVFNSEKFYERTKKEEELCVVWFYYTKRDIFNLCKSDFPIQEG